MNLYFVICIIFGIACLIFLLFGGSYLAAYLRFDRLTFWYFFTAFICGSIATCLGHLYYFN